MFKKVTLRDISREAGVSCSTVTQILNGNSNLTFSSETRSRVLRTAADLGYQTQLMRKAIKRPLKNIGYILCNTAANELRHVMGEIFDAIHAAAYDGRHSLCVSELPWLDEEKPIWRKATESLCTKVDSRMYDALIIDKSCFGDEQLNMLLACTSRIVLINGRLPREDSIKDSRVGWVCIDHFDAARRGAEYLRSLGHRRCALLWPGASYRAQTDIPSMLFHRRDGFLSVYKNTPHFMVGLRDADALRAALREALAAKPTALFVADDFLAVKTIHLLNDMGVSVPGDVSVLGYGRTYVMDLSPRPLTTVDIPWKTMGTAAVRMHMNGNLRSDILRGGDIIPGETVISMR